MDPSLLAHPAVQAAIASASQNAALQAAAAVASAAPPALPNLNLPAPMRSNTAVPELTDAIDDNIFSSGVYASQATGELPLFSVPFGGNMLVQPTGTTLAAHQARYDDTTTTLKEAGRLGSLGDAAVRSVGISCEQAGIVQSTGAPTTYGMNMQELAETLSKTNCTIKIATREYLHGATRHYPGLSGVDGFVSSVTSNQTASVVRNGSLDGKGRRLNINIRIGRADTIEAKIRVTSGATLNFGTNVSGNQPSLLWVEFLAFLGRDLR